MLTETDIDHYEKYGYVVPDFVLPTEVINDIAKQHDALTNIHPEFNDYCPALLAYDTWFLSIAKRNEILDMVQQLIGPDFALWNSSFFAKPAKIGSRTPWHQDGEYWPIEPLATCTVWIAIDASTQLNGCLRVIPESHKNKALAPHVKNTAKNIALNLELEKDQFDESSAVDIELKAGQISLHDVYLFHGSEPNRSDQSRRGLTLRYMPTSSVYQHEKSKPDGKPKPLNMSQRTVYQMRGDDVSGQNDFSVRS